MLKYKIPQIVTLTHLDGNTLATICDSIIKKNS